MIFQLVAAEAKTSDVVGCFFMARNAGVSSSVRRSTKIKGMMRQPTKNGIRQPQAATVAAGIDSLRTYPMIAATKIATCCLAVWNEALKPLLPEGASSGRLLRTRRRGRP